LDAEILEFLPLKGGWEGDGLTPVVAIIIIMGKKELGIRG
jgi:hypothetical protein